MLLPCFPCRVQEEKDEDEEPEEEESPEEEEQEEDQPDEDEAPAIPQVCFSNEERPQVTCCSRQQLNTWFANSSSPSETILRRRARVRVNSSLGGATTGDLAARPGLAVTCLMRQGCQGCQGCLPCVMRF